MRSKEASGMDVLEGTISDISDRTWNEGWTFGTLRYDKGTIRITGHLSDVHKGMKVKLHGDYEHHPKYGRGFAVTNYEEAEPEDQGVVAWLVMRMPEIGYVRANAIMERFGEDVWDILENDPMKLVEINGITEERAIGIGAMYNRVKDERLVLISLFNAGLRRVEALRMLKGFGKEESQRMASDPYEIYLADVGFSYRRAFDTKQDTTFRLAATGVELAVRYTNNTGDTVFDDEDLSKHDLNYLKLSEHELVESITEAIKRGYMQHFDDGVMLVQHAKAEATISNLILRYLKDEDEPLG